MTSAPLYIDQEAFFPWHLLMEATVFLWKDWPKEMKLTCVDRTKRLFTLNGICPHCGDRSVFTEVSSKYQETNNNGFFHTAVVMQCQGCMELILGMFKHWPDGEPISYSAHYPLGKPSENLHPSIPADVAQDFQEAIRCQWAKAYRACVVMCRRALQTSVLALQAKGDTLVKQIDDLAARGTITAPLKEFAHEIRLTGNVDAHSDGLQEVNDKDAEAIIEFTREYLDHVYVMPAKLQARRANSQPQIKKP